MTSLPVTAVPTVLAQPRCLGEVPAGFRLKALGSSDAAKFAQRYRELAVAAEFKPDPRGTAEGSSGFAGPAELPQRMPHPVKHLGLGWRVAAGAGCAHAEPDGGQLLAVAAMPAEQRPEHAGQADRGGMVTAGSRGSHRGYHGRLVAVHPVSGAGWAEDR